MSDEEYEKFEITDRDLETEFNPNRFRRKQTKEQATYGVWAQDSDDDEGHKPRSSGGRGTRANYTSGVAFVSGGLHQPGKKEDAEVEKDEEGQIVQDIPVTDSSSEEEQLPSFGRSKGKGKFEMPLTHTAGLRSHDKGSKTMDAYGIGARMALKMGYEPGKGLGKELQGIAAPIEAFVRKGRGAIGAYGKEARSKPAELPPEPKPSVSKQAREPGWRKGEAGSIKTEYKYVTVDEVLEKKSMYMRPDAGKLAQTKVIDLTGRETRVLSGYHEISGARRPEDDDRANERFKGRIKNKSNKSILGMQTMLRNIDQLVNNCEEDIRLNDRKRRYAEERKQALEKELGVLDASVEVEKEHGERLQKLMEMITRLSEPDVGHDEALEMLGSMEKDYLLEWNEFELFRTACTVGVDKLIPLLKSWEPLANPSEPFDRLSGWYILLGCYRSSFQTIMWEAWMPSIRRSLEAWNVKDAGPVLNLLEIWRPLIPAWIFTNILDQIALPKINCGVDAWDPLSDHVPIHAWIHPWLPVLGDKLEMVYPVIRRKLANALVHWHPSDSSGKQILTPWISVFSKGSMDAFLIKNIVPKLGLALQSLVITPQTQAGEPWNWVMDWCDIIPSKSFVEMFETHFFPKWLNFLIAWLNSRPVFEEIHTWYIWWRTMFPEILMRDPAVTRNLQKALEMINAAIQSPGVILDFSYIMGRSSPAPPPVLPPIQPPMTMNAGMMADAIRLTSQVPNGFRDLVQMKCEQLGLLFMPIPNRYYEGKQVYRCGEVAIYITANVIFIFKDGVWIPSSLQQLLQVARDPSLFNA